ncbi:ATP-binding cassette domain-containing protein [Nocardioides daphniae]|uniref:ATP-binding cassette domain-containing protein n=1 Tax=Nocardioides daphniae TaxID=402297 RepID=UPI001930EB4F|nr:ATP-binding cassette domain-containing protein [Nocardioides daphniae]
MGHATAPTAQVEASAMFALEHVTVTFGGLVALTDASLSVAPHSVHGVIGPNGAGKTTLFNVACGFVRPDEGRDALHGRHLPRLRPHDLPRLGIARTLQGSACSTG